MVLTDLRRNERQPQRPVHLFLAHPGHRPDPAPVRRRRVIILRIQPVFVERVALLERPLAQSHIVLLRAGEVHHRRAPTLPGNNAKIHLQPSLPFAPPSSRVGVQCHPHRRLALSSCQHRLDPRRCAKVLARGRRIARAHEKVDVAHRVAPAPQRPRKRHHLDAAQLSHVVHQMLGQRQRQPELNPLTAAGHEQQRSLDFRDRLLAHAWKREDRPVVNDPLEPLDRRDAQTLPHRLDRLGAQPRNRHHVEQPARHLPTQLLVLLHHSAGVQFHDLVGHLGPYAGNLAQLRRLPGDRFQRARVPLQRPGRPSVGIHPELVLAQQFQHGGDFFKTANRVRLQAHVTE